MARTIVVQRRRYVGSAVLLAGAAVIAGSLFLGPDHDRLLTPSPPARPALPQLAPASVEPHRRTQGCDGAEQATVHGPRPLTPPQSWFSSDDYPALALVGGHAGLTTVELVIGTAGMVDGCGVAGSSGHFTLDRQSCAVFRHRARFAPAEDARGCPVPGIWHQRVRWVIPPI